jgi:ABC-type sugar transport system substrate-binding protein
MEQGEGVVVTVVSGVTEADLACGLLRANGIECAYRDTEEIESSLEDFIQSGPQEILVSPADLDAARELLASAGSGS